MEKMADRANVFRNSRLEEREAKKFEADRHQRREKLFLKIQEQFEKEFRQPGRLLTILLSTDSLYKYPWPGHAASHFVTDSELSTFHSPCSKIEFI